MPENHALRAPAMHTHAQPCPGSANAITLLSVGYKGTLGTVAAVHGAGVKDRPALGSMWASYTQMGCA